MAFDLDEPRPIPEMDVDGKECTVPLTCRKCLELCPQAVFALVTVKYAKYVENDLNDPGAYKVTPRHRDRCTGCLECVAACPKGAISIRFGGEGGE